MFLQFKKKIINEFYVLSYMYTILQIFYFTFNFYPIHWIDLNRFFFKITSIHIMHHAWLSIIWLLYFPIPHWFHIKRREIFFLFRLHKTLKWMKQNHFFVILFPLRDWWQSSSFVYCTSIFTTTLTLWVNNCYYQWIFYKNFHQWNENGLSSRNRSCFKWLALLEVIKKKTWVEFSGLWNNFTRFGVSN